MPRVSWFHSVASGPSTRDTNCATRHSCSVQKHFVAALNPAVRDELMKLWIRAEVLRLTNIRASQKRSLGNQGPEGSIGKLFGARVMTEMGELALAITGPSGVAAEDGGDDFRWHQGLLGAPAAHIAGGSDEVMKNILGERVLGLPGDIRVDKELPWSKVPRS